MDSGLHRLTQLRRARSRHTVGSAPGLALGPTLTSPQSWACHQCCFIKGFCQAVDCLLADGGFRDTKNAVPLRLSRRVQGQAGPAPIPLDQEGILPWSAEAAGAQHH